MFFHLGNFVLTFEVMASEMNFSVEHFNGKNFTVWKRRVRAVFAAKDLDKYFDKEVDETNETEKKESKKAYALLLTLLDDNILASLPAQTTVKKIWSELEQKYEHTSAVSQNLIRKRLTTMKKRRDCSMQKHIDELLSTVNELRMSGAEVSEMDVVIYLLMSLPSEYDIVKTTIENQPSANLTFDFVMQRLLSAEAMKGEKNFGKSEQSAASDHVAFRADRSDKRDIICFKCKGHGHMAKSCRKKIICYHCGKAGHTKKFCRSKQTQSESAAVAFVVGSGAEGNFILDSGASTHMCSKPEWFDDLQPFSGNVKCASRKDVLKIEGIGSICGTLNDKKITLSEVLYVPELNGELISVKDIQTKGYTVIFENGVAVVEKQNERFVVAKLNELGQYICDFKPVKAIANVSVAENDAELWHRRMGHSSNQVLKELGLSTSSKLSDFCEECIMAKHANTAMGKGPRSRESEAMRMVHTDICGPIDPPTREGAKYFLTIVDDHSSFCEVHLLQHKSDVFGVFKLVIRENTRLYKIRCDNAKEYVSGALAQYCKEKGVQIDPAPPYTPALNGTAERANQYLLEKARALIYEAQLPKNFWGYAVLTAAYLKNRLPSQSIENRIPYELKYLKKPDLNVIRVFVCDAYMRIPDSQRKKLDPKSKKMIFVGYASMGYRLLDPTSNRLVVSRNVKFNEAKKTKDSIQTDTLHNHAEGTVVDAPPQDNVEDSPQPEGDNVEDNSLLDDDLSIETDEYDESTTDLPDPDADARPKRNVRLPAHLDDYYVYEAVAALDTVPFEEVNKLSDEEQSFWKQAMNQEMESLRKNKVWELVDLPNGEKPLTCKWVLRVKRDNVYKARLVARGYEQKLGVNYFETFAPVVGLSSLRLVLAIALQKEMKIFALDVKTAFLNGELDEIVYMHQPPGYDDGSGRVCKLFKSLYGLKQGPRQWFKKFIDYILHLNFHQIESEPCIFVRKYVNSEILIVLYVDDVLIVAGSDEAEVQIVIQLLRKEFEMSKSEVANEFLGIKLEYVNDKLYLSQKSYVQKVLDKFKMSECKHSDTPLVPKSTASDFVNSEKFHGPYRELVGALLYLSMTTRPDILYSVNVLSQLQEQPTEAAWAGLKRVLRYLKGTLELKLTFDKSESEEDTLNCFVDADWGSDRLDRKSINGFIIMFNKCPIIWCVRKQTSIALSSTEAEILALAKATQDLIVLYDLTKELLGHDNIKINVFEDNQSAIKAILNDKVNGRLKHLDIKLKYVRNCIKSLNINLEYICTNKQVADLFTKSLPKPRLCDLRFECRLDVIKGGCKE